MVKQRKWKRKKEFGVGGVGKSIGVGKMEKYGFNLWSGENVGKWDFKESEEVGGKDLNGRRREMKR